MGRNYEFKYLVIGSGPAGSAVATSLAKARKNVALVEGGPYGGANLNTRDIPYAVALNFAHTYYQTLHLPEFNLAELSFSFPTVVAHQRQAVAAAATLDNERTAENSGLLYVKGYAQFLDPHTVSINHGERQLTAENFILATGSRLNPAGITGLDVVNCLPPAMALKLRRLPRAVLVIGGGSTGCEIAEYCATLGARTLIIEQGSRLLPSEDPEVGLALQQHFTDDLGVMTLTNSRVVSLTQDALSKYAVFESGGSAKMVRVDTIILATGFIPNLGFGLENTGVKFNQDGSLAVDKFFQTSVKHIYAIGDCAIGTPDRTPAPTGKAKTPKPPKNGRDPALDANYAPDSSTERAAYEGRLLANFLTSKSRTLPNYQGLPRLTNTLPGVACFGPTEIVLRRHHVRYRKAVVELSDIPAGKIYGDRLGFVKLLADRSDHIIAAQIVSKNASTLGNELALAIRHHLTTLELASTPHPTNDYGYAIQLAAKRLISPQK